MPSKKKVVKAYLDPEEFEQISLSAEKAGQSVSKFMRRVCLGFEVRSVVDQRAVLALLKANADLGRVGGLLKKALVDGIGPASEIIKTLRKIETEKDKVVKAIEPIVLKLSAKKR